MAIFEYVATDPSGNSVDGTFEAVDETDARNILAQYNLTPTSLNLQGGAPVQPSAPKIDISNKSTKESAPATKGKKSAKKKKKKVKAVYLIFR